MAIAIVMLRRDDLPWALVISQEQGSLRGRIFCLKWHREQETRLESVLGSLGHLYCVSHIYLISYKCRLMSLPKNCH